MDSKPVVFLSNPGFEFGEPSNPGIGPFRSGSGLGKWRLYTNKTANETRQDLWVVAYFFIIALKW